MMKRILQILLVLSILTSCFGDKKKPEVFSFDKKETREEDKIAYALGQQYARSMKEYKFDKKSEDVFIQGLRKGFLAKSSEKPDQRIIHYAKKIDAIVKKSRKEKAEKKKIEGKAFVKRLLAENSDYKLSSAGLVYKITKAGKVPQNINPNAFITMKYESLYLNDKIYETTMVGNPRKLPIKGIFKAWQEAFRLCGAGCEITIISPSDLTYGDNGALPYVQPGEYLKYKIKFFKYLDDQF